MTVIFDGKNKNFQDSISTSALPQMGGVLQSWLLPMVFGIVTKTYRGGRTFESEEKLNFKGVWQPMSASKLQLKPEGQRSWKWFTVHSEPSLDLKNDQRIIYKENAYRVMERLDYTEYDYLEYHLVDDYTGDDPDDNA